MLRLSFQIILLVLALLQVLAQSQSSDSQFKVMTFNVRYAGAPDGRNRWRRRRNLFMSVINSNPPDILCVQEAEPRQVRYINRKTNKRYEIIGTGVRSNGRGESTRIFVDKSVFSVTDSGTYWLSNDPTSPGSRSYGNDRPRIATWATLTHNSTGKSLLIINTHLDNAVEVARAQGIQQILQSFNTTTIYPEHSYRIPVPPENLERILITGDFNTLLGYDVPEIKSMEDNGFTDTYYELYNTKPRTFHEFLGDKSAEDFPFKIDYIWRKGALKPIESTVIVTQQDGRYPSDHYPIICTLELTSGAESNLVDDKTDSSSVFTAAQI